MIAIYIGCLLLLLYYLYKRNFSYWESRGVPFDKPFLIFGSFYNVATRKQHMFHRIRDIYNQFDTSYVGIHIFNQPNLIIRSPELIRKVLVKDFEKFIDRKIASNEAVDPISAHTFGAQYQVWKNIRTKISPVFTSGKMKLMLPLMKECASDLSGHLERHNGQDIDVRELTKKYAVDIISSCAFGIKSNCLNDDNSEILEVATKLSDFNTFIRSFSIFSFFFLPKFVDIFRLTFLDKTSTNYLIKMFSATYEERKEKNILRNDFIDMLHNLKQNETLDDRYKFDDITMASQAVSFFSAGNDTTSLTVAYALYELALDTVTQDRLRQEIKESFEKDGEFTYEAIQGMKYLDMVLNETLRMYPLTTFVNRKSVGKYKFEETGFTLDKDVAVLIPVAGLHFDPKYFPDPEKFDPERFSDENKHKIVPYTFLPFGDGPRNCLGQRFGTLVSKVALAYCIKDFVFERATRTPVPLVFNPGAFFLATKNKLLLKVRKI